METLESKLSTGSIAEIIFSIVEKVSMFRTHLNNIASPINNETDTSSQVVSYTNCLQLFLRITIETISKYNSALTINECEENLKNLIDIYYALVKFQEPLKILKKDNAPVELHRFIRIFNKGYTLSVSSPFKNTDFNLYIGDELGPHAYENSPTRKYEKDIFIPLLAKIKSDASDINSDNDSFHICVPRIDTFAPLYWPTLVHEVGHYVMKKSLFHQKDIQHDFSDTLPKSGNKIIPSFISLVKSFSQNKQSVNHNEIIKNWLTECWCDLFAFLVIGPAFIFAQKYSLIFTNSSDFTYGSESHPPIYLRLELLYAFALIHHKRLYELYSAELDILETSLVQNVLIENFKHVSDLTNVAQWFLGYFLKHFRLEESHEPAHEYIVKLREYTQFNDIENLKILIARLDGGYPIPSLKTNQEKLTERETKIQEIFLAAWIAYEKTLKKAILDNISSEFEMILTLDKSALWEFFCTNIFTTFDRFNQALMRSLQISEWVELLKTEKDEDYPVYKQKSFDPIDAKFSPTLLNDFQIKQIISNDTLKVIPLINFVKQLGSTSLDVRLGTSFQTYQPNQSGVIDFTDEQSAKNIYLNSTIIDLDFNKSIVIAPGQFVLAHTMEYFGLPENVAAQLEGRSSFARLGIEIHMTASLIDPGFHGAITLEIFNAGPNPIRLFPGYRIGQLRFFSCTQPMSPYNKKKLAKYKGQLAHSSSLLANDYEVENIKKFQKHMDELSQFKHR